LYIFFALSSSLSPGGDQPRNGFAHGLGSLGKMIHFLRPAFRLLLPEVIAVGGILVIEPDVRQGVANGRHPLFVRLRRRVGQIDEETPQDVVLYLNTGRKQRIPN
jgi:hypothetical protein